MPTSHVTVVNRNGAFQKVPRAWLEDGSPFRDQFTLPPSQRRRKARREPEQEQPVPAPVTEDATTE